MVLTYKELKIAEYQNDICFFRKILQTKGDLTCAYLLMEDDIGSEYPNFNSYLKRHLPKHKTIWRI